MTGWCCSCPTSHKPHGHPVRAAHSRLQSHTDAVVPIVVSQKQWPAYLIVIAFGAAMLASLGMLAAAGVRLRRSGLSRGLLIV